MNNVFDAWTLIIAVMTLRSNAMTNYPHQKLMLHDCERITIAHRYCKLITASERPGGCQKNCP